MKSPQSVFDEVTSIHWNRGKNNNNKTEVTPFIHDHFDINMISINGHEIIC